MYTTLMYNGTLYINGILVGEVLSNDIELTTTDEYGCYGDELTELRRKPVKNKKGKIKKCWDSKRFYE